MSLITDRIALIIQQKANNALKTEVAIAARKEMQAQIQEVVYNVYEPVSYERKEYDGGLIADDNIEIQFVADNAISIEDIRHDGLNRNVAYVVETGVGYQFNVPDTLTRGRKFTEATRESLESKGIANLAMKKGLERQGAKTN